MHSWLASLLVDPRTRQHLHLNPGQVDEDGDVAEGWLTTDSGSAYPVHRGIPRFTGTEDDRNSVAASFAFKWAQQSSYRSPRFESWYRAWLLEKYGFRDESGLRSHFARFERVLEVGCGSGMSSVISLGGLGLDQWWVGLDLSSAIDLARETLGTRPNAAFVQADVMALPFAERTFDAVFSEGVLHHTPSTREALAAAVSVLTPGGEVMFYVYRAKAPIREIADDVLRAAVTDLPPERAWQLMEPLTLLAKALADLHADVVVPEDVPMLGVKAGTYDVQRLIYWHFAKLFWNEELGLEGSQHVNFDWYHPRFAHRHTEDEIRGWCDDLGLSIIHFHAQDSGFTVRAVLN